MAERLISRRDLLIGTALLGAAAFLESCDKALPSVKPTLKSESPTATPALEPTFKPTAKPTPTPEPTPEPTPSPTPTSEPTPTPTPEPTVNQTSPPSPEIWIKYEGPQVVWHGDKSKKDVYLTMDDGWNASNMESALRIANDNGIKMTFLPVGRLISLNPGMYKEIISQGHDVQNHTFTHSRLDKQTKDQIKTEVLKARDALWNAVGFEYPQRFMRPPGMYGVTGVSIYQPMLDATKELGFKVLVWDISSAGTGYGAYSKTPEQIAQVEKNVKNNMHNGGISLQHAINVDVAAFPHIASFIKTNGWNPITVTKGLG